MEAVVVYVELQPFDPKTAATAGLQVTASVARDATGLVIRWSVRGALGALSIPANSPAPVRRDNLWQDTCCELLLGVPGDPGYLELNVGPSRDWNLYRFDAERAGMRQALEVGDLPVDVVRGDHELIVEARLELLGVGLAGASLEAAVAAVVRHRHGVSSHWALTHPGSRPDFHARASFALTLPAH